MFVMRCSIVMFTAMLLLSVCGDPSVREPAAKVRRETRTLCTQGGLTYSAGAVVATQGGDMRCQEDGKWVPVESLAGEEAENPARFSSPRD